MQSIFLYDGHEIQTTDEKAEEIAILWEKCAKNIVQLNGEKFLTSTICRIGKPTKKLSYDNYSVKIDKEGGYYLIRDGKRVYIDSKDEHKIVEIEQKNQLQIEQPKINPLAKYGYA